MTDREVLEAILTGDGWGSCEEIAYPEVINAIQGHLAADPDADRYIRIRRESRKDCKNKSEEQRKEDYEFTSAYEDKYNEL